jgi:RNA polymerase sigma factor (sigma-70 family)
VEYDVRAMEDAPLVLAACEGDKQAFADIYDRYADRIFSFLCTVVKNREDAADLLQDTFLTAGARLHQLRNPEKLRPWLYAIARHLAMKNLSRSGRQDPMDDNFEIADTSAGPSEVAAQNELALLIQQASEGLGTQDRIVLDLHLRQGLEGSELGEALGVSAGHAYVMLSRMRDQVERSLGALMVARRGSSDCRKLEAILKPWDGRFTATWRKRVARHADGCDVCGQLRKRVLSPASMLGAIPLIAAPAYARTAVLDRLQLVGYGSEPSSIDIETSAGADTSRWPAGNGGFPPPMAAPRRRPPLAAVLVGAFVLILLLAVPTVALIGDPEPEVKQTVRRPSGDAPATYPLVFNDDVLKTFEPPSPETAAAGTEPAAAGTESAAGKPSSGPKSKPVSPKPKPGRTAAPPPDTAPSAPAPQVRPSTVPSGRPSPSPGPEVPSGTRQTPGDGSDPAGTVRGSGNLGIRPQDPPPR